MEKVLKLYKKEGETPLACMEHFRSHNPEYTGISMTYAGRLDPLACGELLVLAGDAVYEKEAYCACDKEYKVEALLGFETDTYDILGVPDQRKGETKTWQEISQNSISQTLKNFIGKQNQPYPPYSSRTVDGKPLWQWAREGNLEKIEIPTHEIEIYNIKNIEIKEIAWESILKRVKSVVGSVQGDFRQEKILHTWHKRQGSSIASQLVSFTVTCSSGTYIRTLVHQLGQKLGTGACIFRLERTRIFIEENSQQ